MTVYFHKDKLLKPLICPLNNKIPRGRAFNRLYMIEYEAQFKRVIKRQSEAKKFVDSVDKYEQAKKSPN